MCVGVGVGVYLQGGKLQQGNELRETGEKFLKLTKGGSNRNEERDSFEHHSGYI